MAFEKLLTFKIYYFKYYTINIEYENKCILFISGVPQNDSKMHTLKGLE